MKYEILFRVSASIKIEAESREEAKQLFFNSDDTPTEEILEAIKESIKYIGNDGIEIDDIWEEE